MKKNAFTLMELLIVVILVSIIAGFAIPNFSKAIRKSHEKDAVAQLRMIHAANKIYQAHEQEYLQGSSLSTDDINDQLNINIFPNEKTYSYSSSSTSAYTATATHSDFAITIDEQPISNSNPCCSGGSCPSLPNC